MDGYWAGRVLGPLAPYADGFVAVLVKRGYRPRSVRGASCELMAHLEPLGWSRRVASRRADPGMTRRGSLRGRRERMSALTGARALDPLVGYCAGSGSSRSGRFGGFAVTGCWRTTVTTGARAGADGQFGSWHWTVSRGCSWLSAPSRWRRRCDGLTAEVTGFVIAQCRPGGRAGATREEPDERAAVAAPVPAPDGRVPIRLADRSRGRLAGGWRRCRAVWRREGSRGCWPGCDQPTGSAGAISRS